jgi:hypothetical protein
MMSKRLENLTMETSYLVLLWRAPFCLFSLPLLQADKLVCPDRIGCRALPSIAVPDPTLSVDAVTALLWNKWQRQG